MAEDVHLVGISILSGSHMELVPEILRGLRDAGAGEVPVRGSKVASEIGPSDAVGRPDRPADGEVAGWLAAAVASSPLRPPFQARRPATRTVARTATVASRSIRRMSSERRRANPPRRAP